MTDEPVQMPAEPVWDMHEVVEVADEFVEERDADVAVSHEHIEITDEDVEEADEFMQLPDEHAGEPDEDGLAGTEDDPAMAEHVEIVEASDGGADGSRVATAGG